MVRIAAIGDLHVRTEVPLELAADLARLRDRADALVIAGDISDTGRLVEFEIAAEALAPLALPIIAVLGNHDRRCLRRTALRRILEGAGVELLDGASTTVTVTLRGLSGDDGPWGSSPLPRSLRVGFAGVGGYGGGFWPDEGPLLPPYRATQALAVRARREAARLDAALSTIDPDVDLIVAVMHYSPTASTLGREPLAKHWMLGSSELARVVDRYAVDLVIHGHAHLGNPAGQTVGGTPVRNVATTVVGGPVVHELSVPKMARLASVAWPSVERRAGRGYVSRVP